MSTGRSLANPLLSCKISKGRKGIPESPFLPAPPFCDPGDDLKAQTFLSGRKKCFIHRKMLFESRAPCVLPGLLEMMQNGAVELESRDTALQRGRFH